MSAWVASEAVRLAIASDVMLAVGAATALAAHALGHVVHHRALAPTMSWAQSFAGAAQHEQHSSPLASRWPTGGVNTKDGDRQAVRRALEVPGVAVGLSLGLVGVTLAATSGHVPYPGHVLLGALLASMVASLLCVAWSRPAGVRKVLARRGPHLMASAVFREASGVVAMVVPILVVAHTAGLSETSILEIGAVALATRLVIAAVPVAGGLVIADIVLVVGLAWTGIPVPVGLAAVLIWRVGSVAAVLIAAVISHRTEPVTLVWDLPTKDGAGRRLHRAVFTLVGMLPSSLRARATGKLFDTMFAMSPDPWGYSAIPYEQRKRQYLLDVVGPEARVVVEVGCADGHNLLALAEALPAATIVGTDVSTAAVRIAAHRTRALPNVRVINASDSGALTGALPAPADWIVLAEVLYYLGGRQAMAEALAPLRQLMLPDARVVMIHGCADAQMLHARAASALGLTLVEQLHVADPERPFEVAVAASHR